MIAFTLVLPSCTKVYFGLMSLVLHTCINFSFVVFLLLRFCLRSLTTLHPYKNSFVSFQYMSNHELWMYLGWASIKMKCILETIKRSIWPQRSKMRKREMFLPALCIYTCSSHLTDFTLSRPWCFTSQTKHKYCCVSYGAFWVAVKAFCDLYKFKYIFF